MGILKTFRNDQQINRCKEELAELIVALSHFQRRTGYSAKMSVNEVVDEIADVTIMLEQMLIMFTGLNDLIKKRVEYKISKLASLLRVDYNGN
jgi:hypothetical protein